MELNATPTGLLTAKNVFQCGWPKLNSPHSHSSSLVIPHWYLAEVQISKQAFSTKTPKAKVAWLFLIFVLLDLFCIRQCWPRFLSIVPYKYTVIRHLHRPPPVISFDLHNSSVRCPFYIRRNWDIKQICPHWHDARCQSKDYITAFSVKTHSIPCHLGFHDAIIMSSYHVIGKHATRPSLVGIYLRWNERLREVN